MRTTCVASRSIDLRAVLFDLGGTLIDTAARSEILSRILAPYGIQRTLAMIGLAFREVDEELPIQDYALPYSEFWRLYNLKILNRLGISMNFGKLADAITDEWWDKAEVRLFADVEETLATLKEMGLKIGIVTNGFQTDIQEILSRTGLTGLFDVAVGADDVGKPKPNRKIFLYALEKLGITPQEALFVGDNPKTDYEGAEAAGLKPILIDRDDKATGRFVKIRDLREVTRHTERVRD